MGILTYACTAGSLFFVEKRVFSNARLAHLTTFLLLGLNFLVVLSSANFEPKMLAVLLQLWGIYYALEKKWFPAGLFFSLAVMCWQPMVINCVSLFVFIVLSNSQYKESIKSLCWLFAGVLVGTLPVVFYLGFTDQWLDFWNQAVVRKVNVEGDAIFESYLNWFVKAIYPKFLSEAIYFLFGALGFLFMLYKLIGKGKPSFSQFTDGKTVKLLLALTVFWILFNSLAFQGAPDLIPLIPLILFWSAYIMNTVYMAISSQLSKKVLVFALVAYSFFDLLLPKVPFSYEDQKSFIT
ncbi:MAG: hypothetical protein Roseis2KO_57740 [Roseivirga sp.]